MKLVAYDADVLIYAASPEHHLGRRVIALLAGDGTSGIGSVLLLPEVLTKPIRSEAEPEVVALLGILSRLELRPVDQRTSELAVGLTAKHGLRAADAVHLATAIVAAAELFVTNNRRDFGPEIDEIDVLYPDALPEP